INGCHWLPAIVEYSGNSLGCFRKRLERQQRHDFDPPARIERIPIIPKLEEQEKHRSKHQVPTSNTQRSSKHQVADSWDTLPKILPLFACRAIASPRQLREKAGACPAIASSRRRMRGNYVPRSDALTLHALAPLELGA